MSDDELFEVAEKAEKCVDNPALAVLITLLVNRIKQLKG